MTKVQALRDKEARVATIVKEATKKQEELRLEEEKTSERAGFGVDQFYLRDEDVAYPDDAPRSGSSEGASERSRECLGCFRQFHVVLRVFSSTSRTKFMDCKICLRHEMCLRHPTSKSGQPLPRCPLTCQPA